MVSIRPERLDDADAIRRVHIASFPTPAEAQLVDLLRDAGHLSISLVSELDCMVVGHIAFSPVSTDSGQGGLGLAPVAMLPACRGQAIARRLIDEGIALAQRLGFSWLVVLGEPEY